MVMFFDSPMDDHNHGCRSQFFRAYAIQFYDLMVAAGVELLILIGGKLQNVSVVTGGAIRVSNEPDSRWKSTQESSGHYQRYQVHQLGKKNPAKFWEENREKF